jgi:hypothetical protein
LSPPHVLRSQNLLVVMFLISKLCAFTTYLGIVLRDILVRLFRVTTGRGL